jgi:peroxiredoxin Q/BCP
MRKVIAGVLATGTLCMGLATGACAQEEQAFLSVGEMAPDIEFQGATRHGVLADGTRLSDYRGETIVLAFFFRARTRG